MRPVCELASKKAVHRAVARAGQVAGFSLPQGTFSPRSGAHLVHAGVAAKAAQREKVRAVTAREAAQPAIRVLTQCIDLTQ